MREERLLKNCLGVSDLISKSDAWAEAVLAVAGIFGKDFVKEKLLKSPSSVTEIKGTDNSNPRIEFFFAFESDGKRASNSKWTCYAWVSVDLVTEKASFLNYCLPDGQKMKNPIRLSKSFS